MGDYLLVVPAHLALRLAEDIFLLHALVSQVVDNRIMKFQEGQVKLRNDEVNVISRITKKRPSLAIPGKVLHLISIVQAEQELVHVVDIVEVGTTRWPGSIQGFEVETRRAKVAQFIEASMVQQQTAVSRNIVRDELAQESKAYRDTRIVGRCIVITHP